MNKAVEIAFQLITYAGNGRGLAMEAIREAREGNFETAHDLLREAKESIGNAHTYQTQLIQSEAAGEVTELSILLIHAQDHLMTGMTVIDMADEFVKVYESR